MNNFLEPHKIIYNFVGGYNYNQKVDLPHNLTHLTWYCNQKVDLPQNLIKK